MTEARDLLPCPFCGSDATLFQLQENLGPPSLTHSLYWTIGCYTEDCRCQLQGAVRGWPRKKDAALAWNTRADQR